MVLLCIYSAIAGVAVTFYTKECIITIEFINDLSSNIR